MATFFKSFQFLFTILIVLELGLPSRGTIFQPAAWRSSGEKKKEKQVKKSTFINSCHVVAFCFSNNNSILYHFIHHFNLWYSEPKKDLKNSIYITPSMCSACCLHWMGTKWLTTKDTNV